MTKNNLLSSLANKPATVGILMPVYNLGAYIDDALDSIEKQTFRDFELLIVDDASTDPSTIKKIKELKKSGKYRVVIQKKNTGLGSLASKHLPTLSSKYLMLFSSDDILEPTYLEETVQYLDLNPDTAAVSSYLSMFGDRTGLINPTPDKYSLPSMLVENLFVGSALIRRSSLEDIGWISSHPDHEDYLQWLSVLSLGQKLHLIPKPLLNYRIRGASKSNSFTRQKNRAFEKLLVDTYPDLYRKYSTFVIKNKIERIDEVELAYEKLVNDVETLTGDIQHLRNHIEVIEANLNKLQASRIHKAARFIRRILRIEDT